MNKSSHYVGDDLPRHGVSLESPYTYTTQGHVFRLIEARSKDNYWCFDPKIEGIRDPKYKGTVFLDLDNTLLRSEFLHTNKLGGYNNVFKTTSGCDRGVFVRPKVKEFLEAIQSMNLEIVFFTAATSDYAKEYTKILDPERKYVNFILSRHSCDLHEKRENYFVKDIGRFRDLERSVIVDDDIINFCKNPLNGIPIKRFSPSTIFEAMMDEELPNVEVALKEIFEYKDVRVGVFNNVGYKLIESGS